MMKPAKIFSLIMFLSLVLISWNTSGDKWILERYDMYNLSYTSTDKNYTGIYRKMIETGIQQVQAFFDDRYKSRFNVFFYPNRQLLDSTWQKDWNMPEFKSECWMVASGVADKLDILSPAVWDQQACEHSFANKTEIQKVITHELVHVFHGQVNVSPGFNNTEGLDWFVEGLATYVSGQYDSARASQVRNALIKNPIPLKLDSLWTGRLRYGLSGSVVAFIDHTYGRKKLRELLLFNQKTEVLSSLHITEKDLLTRWKAYMIKDSLSR